MATLADGMGGMPGGYQASRIVVRAFLDGYATLNLPAPERLRGALAHANDGVGAAIDAQPELEGMGSTFLAAVFFPGYVDWLSVGDSFILVCRTDKLQRINPLHIYAKELDEMVRRGETTPDAARNHPDRAALTSAVQGKALREVDQGRIAVQPGDLVMLASDGIATLPPDELTVICATHADQDVKVIATEIIDHVNALQRQDQDNATVLVVRCPQTEPHQCGNNVEALERPPTKPGCTAIAPDPAR